MRLNLMGTGSLKGLKMVVCGIKCNDLTIINIWVCTTVKNCKHKTKTDVQDVLICKMS